MTLRTTSVAIGLLVVALAGCGAGGTPTPLGFATPSASAAPSAVGPSPSAAASPAGTFPVGGLPHDDPDLEARLPKAVDGKPIGVFSVGPISSAGNPGAEPVKALARELGDGSGNFGLAFATDPAAPTFNIFALRVPGASAAPLVERYGALTVADTAGGVSEAVTIGGRDVVHVTSPGNPIGDVWFYATGDTLFGVQAGSVEQATALLALLP